MATDETKPVISSAVFSMFGGGAKKEKKDDDKDRGDNSGSAKAQREAAEAAKGDQVRRREPIRGLAQVTGSDAPPLPIGRSPRERGHPL